MARRAATQSRTRSSGAEQAHEALARYLSNGRYWHKLDLAQKLRDDGFEHQCGYVMTKARRNGHVVVLGPEQGVYTAKPSGIDVLKDLRKRRKVSYAWIRNVQAVASYATSNWGRITTQLDEDQKRELRAEIEYIQRAVPQMETAFRRSGL